MMTFKFFIHEQKIRESKTLEFQKLTEHDTG